MGFGRVADLHYLSVKRLYLLEVEGLGEGVGFAFELDFGLGEGEALAFEPFLAVGEGEALALEPFLAVGEGEALALEPFLAVGEGDALACGASFSATASTADNFTHCGSSLLAGCEQ